MLGAEPGCGDDWFAAYGPGSTPGDSNAPAFTVASVLADIEQGYTRLLELSKSASQELLDQKHGLEFLEPVLMSKRDLMSHLLSTHITFHACLLYTSPSPRDS